MLNNKDLILIISRLCRYLLTNARYFLNQISIQTSQYGRHRWCYVSTGGLCRYLGIQSIKSGGSMLICNLLRPGMWGGCSVINGVKSGNQHDLK